MVIRTRGRLPDGWGSSPHSLDASASTACHARSPAMTTNKPEVKRYDMSACPEHICRVFDMQESEDGDYVEWEAYEALQAECEKLRKDAERYQWLRDAGVIEGDVFSSINEWLWAGGDFQEASSDIDDAMQEGRKP